MSGRNPFLPLAAAGLLALSCAAHAQPSFVDHCSVHAHEALLRINAARAVSHRCGGRSMAPAPALRWDSTLQGVAAGHSRDMAQHNYFDHRSPDGRTVAERVAAAHYSFRAVGENLAGGDASIADAVQGWLDSPHHCENLMDPRFIDVAVACAGNAQSEWGTYWTMILGRRS